MISLTISKLIDIWVMGQDRHPIEIGVMLLAAAYPETSFEDLSRLSLRERDSRLLELHEKIFGCEMLCLAACPQCGNKLEMMVTAEDIGAGSKENRDEKLSLSLNGYEVRFHLPNSLDLAEAVIAGDESAGRRILLDRCFEEIHFGDSVVTLNQIPADVLSYLVEKIDELDPQENNQLNLNCPICDHRWQATLDIVSFLWKKISAWARRTLWDVHILASAYGWSEADILAMNPRRRQVYLEMVNR